MLKCNIFNVINNLLPPLNIKILLIFSLTLFYTTNSFSQSKYTISGFVRDASDGEELIGVTIYVEEIGTGTITNAYGFYSLTLPAGEYSFRFSYVGYEQFEKKIELKENLTFNIEMPPSTLEMEEIVVSSTPIDENVQGMKMSRVEIDIEKVKKLPALFGEADIIKTIQMQPGVISAGEGTSGYFVRGGSADQNLILIDEAPIYDPSHLFGLFSVFNADILKDSELYKGGIPARFGGRLSSILDVRTKDGNSKQFEMNGGIGSMASRLMFEGPILKDKSSYVISGRRSYLDVFQRLSSDPDISENLISFYDVNAKVNWKHNNNNRFFLATYLGRDSFRFGDEFGFDWGNATFTFRWNHLFSDKLFANTTIIGSNFDYGLSFTDPVQGFDWTANLQETSGKIDFTYFANPRNEISFGYHGGFKRFSPGRIEPSTENSIMRQSTVERMRALEHSFYLGNEQKVTDRLSLQYGVRFTVFQNIGKSRIFKYRDQQDNINIDHIDTLYYDDFELIESFQNPEPRLAARFLLNPSTSLKMSYNRMVQYVHLISNSTVPVPFNTWQPSSPYVDPQVADQIALGYFKNFKQNSFEFSAEAYYKWMKNVVDFADNAELFFNNDLATEFRQGDAYSYGVELFLRKSLGVFDWTASYTWSKAMRQIPGINDDKEYRANYDRRHNLYLTGTYQLNDKWTIGGNFVYSTGRPMTLPAGRYEFENYNPDFYTYRNEYLMPDFHRLDLSATLTPRKNKDRRWQGSWNFSLYNVYNRQNPFTIYTRTKQDADGNIIGDGTEKEARMVYMFPILPSVTYNFKF